ncbi:MAG: AMP-dependent synthetase/ligase, partial [Halobacteriota archaeon]
METEDGGLPRPQADWFDCEREHSDDLVGEDPLPALIDRKAVEYDGDVAQVYKGGVHRRSLSPGVLEEPERDEYAALTYAELRSIYRTLALGFDSLGVEDGDHVAIYSETRLEWIQVDLALQVLGATVTTVYPSSSVEQAGYLLDDSDARFAVVGGEAELETALEASSSTDVERYVVMDDVDTSERDDVHGLDEVHALGAKRDVDEVDGWIDSLEPGDLATIIYTSGTTGQPKGVMLSHENLRACFNQVWRRLGPRDDKPEGMLTLGSDLDTLSFLPMAHAFERFVHLSMLASGASIAYAESVEADVLAEDIRRTKPHGIATVPRMLERIYGSIVERAARSGVSGRVVDWALDVGRSYWDFFETSETPTGVAYYTVDAPFGLRLRHALASRLVYDRVREALGGEIQGFLSAGGSLSEDVARSYLGMNLPVIEGYGMTEAGPVISMSPLEDPRVGTLGPPLAEVEVKLDGSVVGDDAFEDVTGDVGELLVRGPNVFEGYYGMPEETDEAFEDADDGDDWFRTGDVVEVDDDGYLSFVERVKNLVVLSTGKNVAVEHVEEKVEESEFVAQCMA